jgi:2'-5' RNA ligase
MEETARIIPPDYRVYQYLLILSPPEELRNKIMEIKKVFYDKYKADTTLWSKPHITLTKFVQFGIAEDRIINRLHCIAMGYPPIKIELQDYGSFPSHTIFININHKLPIQNLVIQIRTEAHRLLKLSAGNTPQYIMNPHLSIAKNLLLWQYERSWPEYCQKHFTGMFIADAMLLLKRQVGTLKYQIAQRLEFQNLPVTTKQGELFM